MSPEKPFCVNCAHLLGKRSMPELAQEWRCAAEGNVQDRSHDPVTGAIIYKFICKTCYEAREIEEACGSKGRWFKEYAPMTFAPRTSEDLLNELENLK